MAQPESAAVAPENAVILKNASLTYETGNDAIMVLNHLNMEVPKGSIYGLLGASGCGKTTLLTCIAGLMKLSEGEVKVLGGIPGTKGSGVPGPKIGYMPQEVALVDEMDVGNVIYYFGLLFGMSSSEIAERYTFLSKLLELPDKYQLVKNLSGGQKRRVSFAAALVQTPELLILDEPTVGLDPVLRQNIWDYLVQITAECKMTVIITTHYIEEATQAHKIGLLREGTLLADMAPDVLIAQYNCTTLEEVFLKLSIKQREGEVLCPSYQPITKEQVKDRHGAIKKNSREYHTDAVTAEKYSINPNVFKSAFHIRMKALMYKNFLAILRNLPGLLLMFLLPVVIMSLFFPSVGVEPKGLSIGIVNDELVNCHEMLGKVRNDPGVVVVKDNYDDKSCHHHALSCLFIDKLSDTAAKRIYYSDQATALAASKMLITSATVQIPRNFSDLLQERMRNGFNTNKNTLENLQIKVWQDMTNYMVAYKLRKHIYSTYQAFVEDIAVSCHRNKRIDQLPVLFMEPLYGDDATSYRVFMAPGYIIAMVFFFSSVNTATLLSTERTNGVWCRNLVAGVTACESILSHILIQITVMLIQMSLILLVAFYLFEMVCQGNFAYVLIIVFLQCVTGTAFGLLIGSFCKNISDVMVIIIGTFFPYLLIMGAIWPLEGSPRLLQFISSLSPGTLAANSLRNILSRGWGFLHPQVYPGYIMSVLWIVGQFALSVWFLRKKL